MVRRRQTGINGWRPLRALNVSTCQELPNMINVKLAYPHLTKSGTVTTSHNRCNYRRNQQLMAQCLWPWVSSRSTRQRTPSDSRQTQTNNVKQTFPFRLKYVLRQQRFGIQNYPVIAMNNGKSATLTLIEDHNAKAIPPIKRRIIIHDTSESEDDTSDLPARGSFDAHIVVYGNADGQHQGISLSGDPINIHRQHAQMELLSHSHR